jgi:hypothetical protein
MCFVFGCWKFLRGDAVGRVSPRVFAPCLAFLLLFALLTSAAGQQSSQPAAPAQARPGQGDIGIQVQPAPPPADKKITPEQARELFASVDEILNWLSKDTGFAIKSKVKRELASRDQVSKYVESRLSDDEDAKRLQRSEIVLKKFGLLPRTFDLHTFLVKLLREQVAGYYDVKTKTVYLLDWLTPESQKPVLAHELTHALQDQNFNLKDWEDPKAPKSAHSDEFSYDEDEASTARSAVAEGQGMVTLVDFMLRASGHTVADSPQVVPMMKSAMTANSGFPLLEQAPLMIRESLVFPYGDGLSFEGGLLQNGGKDFAFSGPFRRPPQDTHEVLDLNAYLHSRPPEWLVIPDFKQELAGSGYEKYDVGSIGQLDTRTLVQQYAGAEAAQKMAAAWKGGAYYAASSNDPKLTGTAKLGLLYLSRWKSDEDADEFAKIYADYLPKRFSSVKPGPKCKSQDSDEGGCATQSFVTEEGPITIQHIPGAEVLVIENFPAEVASKLAEKVLLANPENSVSVQEHSLMSPLRNCAVIREVMGSMIARRFVALNRAQ